MEPAHRALALVASAAGSSFSYGCHAAGTRTGRCEKKTQELPRGSPPLERCGIRYFGGLIPDGGASRLLVKVRCAFWVVVSASTRRAVAALKTRHTRAMHGQCQRRWIAITGTGT